MASYIWYRSISRRDFFIEASWKKIVGNKQLTAYIPSCFLKKNIRTF